MGCTITFRCRMLQTFCYSVQTVPVARSSVRAPFTPSAQKPNEIGIINHNQIIAMVVGGYGHRNGGRRDTADVAGTEDSPIPHVNASIGHWQIELWLKGLARCIPPETQTIDREVVEVLAEPLECLRDGLIALVEIIPLPIGVGGPSRGSRTSTPSGGCVGMPWWGCVRFTWCHRDRACRDPRRLNWDAHHRRPLQNLEPHPFPRSSCPTPQRRCKSWDCARRQPADEPSVEAYCPGQPWQLQ